MHIESVTRLEGRKKDLWQALLAKAELQADEAWEQTALLWEGDRLLATGSRMGNLIKCLAVEPARRGEGLLAQVLTALRQEAFAQGKGHLFLYTKPSNLEHLRSLFFYPVASTPEVLLMENKKNGIDWFLSALPVIPAEGIVGAAVMNCDPFTRGHLHLVETAAAQCSRVYVFVLSEDKGHFSGADRLAMVQAGTAHLPNVTVLPTGPYLISAATFPTYFLKNRDKADTLQCALDIEIFCKHFAPHFGITRRYVGTESLSPMTARYNEALKAGLYGVTLQEIPRLEAEGAPISASAVRRLLEAGDRAALEALLPPTTLEYIFR